MGSLRRFASAAAHSAGLDSKVISRLEIVVTELGTNLTKYALKSAEILIRPLSAPGTSGLEIIAVDSGPGIPDIDRAMQDRFSTGRSQGTGLGAIKRLSDEFQIYSNKEKGTAILARFWNNPEKKQQDKTRFDFAGVSVPLEGETACGDGWATVDLGDRLGVIVVDGIGHGALAAEATQETLNIFARHYLLAPSEIIARIHAGIRKTRGSVLAMALIDKPSATLTYCGIGNIAGQLIFPDKSMGLVSIEGLAGVQLGRVREFTYPWSDDAMLVLSSDGLTSALSTCRTIVYKDAPGNLLSAMLYRDYHRQNDDATVVIVRNAS